MPLLKWASDQLENCLNAALPTRKPFEVGYRPKSEDWYGRVIALVALGELAINYRYADPVADRSFEYEDEKRFKEISKRAREAIAADSFGKPP